jgi:DNA-directed RNA polymerase subunit L
LHDAISLFDEAGAVNFLTFAATHPERGTFAVTIQRADGITPGEKIHALEVEIEELLGQMSVCELCSDH